MIGLRRIEICNKATVIVYSAASSNTNSSAVACVLCYLEMSLRKKSRHIAILQMYTWTHVQRRSLHYAQQAGHAGKSWKRLNVKHRKLGNFFHSRECFAQFCTVKCRFSSSTQIIGLFLSEGQLQQTQKLRVQLLCLRQAGLAGGGVLFSASPFVLPSVCPSVRSFVCYQTNEHEVLNTNEQILAPIGTSGSPGKGTKLST